MGRRRDGEGVDAVVEQSFHRAEGCAAENSRDEIALVAVGIRYADELDTRKIGEYARMVAAHDADAHNTYA
jgi:hypothetical protein